MALYTGRILMRIGNEANYDIDKLMPGEWAVSTDKRIVRICVSAGIGIRMATYEAFEEDMDKIVEILNQCQTIQEAIVRINTEVSKKADAVAEYTEQAKQYRDEAEQYRNEAFSTTPEGYESLVKNVSDNTVKIDTVIQTAELNIKNTASGESIHLTDASENKAVAFALCGKANQYTGGGKNILEIATDTGTYNGITRTVNSDKSISLDGTSTISITSIIDDEIYPEESGMYKLTGSPSDDCCLYVYSIGDYVYKDENKTVIQTLKQGATNKEVEYYLEAGKRYYVAYTIPSANITVSDITIYPMLRLADTDDTYEPYTGGLPIPSPDYPQAIDISGVSGSVEVKSCGKNILKNTATSKTDNGVTFTVNEDKTITVKGTNNSTARVKLEINVIFNKGTYFATGCPIGGNSSTYAFYIQKSDGSGKMYWETGNGVKFDVEEDNTLMWVGLARINAGYTANNLLFKPMIRRCDENGNPIGDDSYEPYKETTSTIPTPNGLAGIPVGSGGNYTDSDGQQRICDESVKYADGTGERIQRVKKFIFNGTESWVKSTLAENVFYNTSKFTDGMLINSIPVICNSYIGTTNSIDFMEDKTVRYAMSGGTTPVPIFYIKDSSFNTVDELKAALASNNIYGYYPLKEAIRTPLTSEEIAEIEKLQTFYSVTNITNDSDCGMKITYLADSKKYIDNQLALQAQAQETAMINMLLLLPEETQAAMIENDTNNLLLESEE